MDTEALFDSLAFEGRLGRNQFHRFLQTAAAAVAFQQEWEVMERRDEQLNEEVLELAKKAAQDAASKSILVYLLHFKRPSRAAAAAASTNGAGATTTPTKEAPAAATATTAVEAEVEAVVAAAAAHERAADVAASHAAAAQHDDANTFASAELAALVTGISSSIPTGAKCRIVHGDGCTDSGELSTQLANALRYSHGATADVALETSVAVGVGEDVSDAQAVARGIQKWTDTAAVDQRHGPPATTAAGLDALAAATAGAGAAPRCYCFVLVSSPPSFVGAVASHMTGGLAGTADFVAPAAGIQLIRRPGAGADWDVAAKLFSQAPGSPEPRSKWTGRTSPIGKRMRRPLADGDFEDEAEGVAGWGEGPPGLG